MLKTGAHTINKMLDGGYEHGKLYTYLIRDNNMTECSTPLLINTAVDIVVHNYDKYELDSVISTILYISDNSNIHILELANYISSLIDCDYEILDTGNLVFSTLRIKYKLSVVDIVLVSLYDRFDRKDTINKEVSDLFYDGRYVSAILIDDLSFITSYEKNYDEFFADVRHLSNAQEIPIIMTLKRNFMTIVMDNPRIDYVVGVSKVNRFVDTYDHYLRFNRYRPAGMPYNTEYGIQSYNFLHPVCINKDGYPRLVQDISSIIASVSEEKLYQKEKCLVSPSPLIINNRITQVKIFEHGPFCEDKVNNFLQKLGSDKLKEIKIDDSGNIIIIYYSQCKTSDNAYDSNKRIS